MTTVLAGASAPRPLWGVVARLVPALPVLGLVSGFVLELAIVFVPFAGIETSRIVPSGDVGLLSPFFTAILGMVAVPAAVLLAGVALSLRTPRTDRRLWWVTTTVLVLGVVVAGGYGSATSQDGTPIPFTSGPLATFTTCLLTIAIVGLPLLVATRWAHRWSAHDARTFYTPT